MLNIIMHYVKIQFLELLKFNSSDTICIYLLHFQLCHVWDAYRARKVQNIYMYNVKGL